MRKLVWFGAAMIVASAGAVYMAADYAARHPDSYLGRCAAAAVYISARSNPVTVAADMVRGEHAQVVGAAGAGAICGALAQDCAHGDEAVVAKPVPDPEDRPEEREAAEPAEVNEPIQVEGLQQELNEDELPWVGRNTLPTGTETLPVVPMQTEEPAVNWQERAEFDPDVFNSKVQSDKPVESGTVESPYSIEVETTAPETIPIPTEEDGNTEEPATEECPCLGDKPCTCGDGCCCWFARMLKMIGCCPENTTEAAPEAAVECEATPEATSDSPEMLEMPIPCDDDEPQAEGVEERPSEDAPMNSIPSYNHYHHGGCPYMGGSCPYYRGTPIVQPVETPRKIRVKKKKKDYEAMYKPVLMEKLWKQLLHAGADDEAQEQMGIDTMEFRPSDDPRDPPGHSPF